MRHSQTRSIIFAKKNTRKWFNKHTWEIILSFSVLQGLKMSIPWSLIWSLITSVIIFSSFIMQTIILLTELHEKCLISMPKTMPIMNIGYFNHIEHTYDHHLVFFWKSIITCSYFSLGMNCMGKYCISGIHNAWDG